MQVEAGTAQSHWNHARERLVDLLRKRPGTDGAVAALLHGDVDTGLQEAVTYAQSRPFDHDASGMADLCLAIHAAARAATVALGPGPVGMRVFLAGVAAHQAVFVLDAAGRHEEVVRCSDDAGAWLREHGETRQLADLLLAGIDARVSLRRAEEAEAALAPFDDWSDPPPAPLSLERVRKRVQDALAAGLGASGSASAAVDAADARALFDQVLGPFDPDTTLTDQRRIQRALQEASRPFHDDRHVRDPDLLRPARDLALRARDAARRLRLAEEENDAHWLLYLCSNRLGDAAAAVEALEALHANLEEMRLRVSDPLRRAGVTIAYPHASAALAQHACAAADAPRLLDAMETARGRMLAEVIQERRGPERHPRPSSFLPTLTRTHGFHYLSLYVDDDATYGVLVDRRGGMHHQRIDLDAETAARLTAWVDPSRWGRRDRTAPQALTSGSVARVPEDIPDRLAPLVSWLAPLIGDGTIRSGDHLCYAPGARLHAVPLQYLPLGAGAVADVVSLSRVEGAQTLRLLLDRPAARPDHAVVVEVPARQDEAARDRRPETWKAFSAVSQALPLPHRRLTGADATPQGVLRKAAPLVHFTTHGTFPPGGDPLTDSGLLLAGPGGLSDKDPARRDGLLLNPRRIHDASLDWEGTHVTMLACVSGLADRGVAGDPLGMEWAWTEAGAASLLVSHWNIDAAVSSDFAVRFYDAWLQDGASRAQAWRTAALAVREEEPRHWAGLTLVGDWR